jgi:hypothetical protein
MSFSRPPPLVLYWRIVHLPAFPQSIDIKEELRKKKKMKFNLKQGKRTVLCPAFHFFLKCDGGRTRALEA